MIRVKSAGIFNQHFIQALFYLIHILIIKASFIYFIYLYQTLFYLYQTC